MKKLRRITESAGSVLLCIVLVVMLFPVHKAKAAETPSLSDLSDMELRAIIDISNEYAKLGAYENLLAAGFLTSGSSAFQAEVNSVINLAKAKTVASGLSAATCAQFATLLQVAGVVVVATDWEVMWNSAFNKEAFDSNWVDTGSYFYDQVVNYTHLDNWVTDYINLGLELGGIEPWDWDYMEMTKSGWETISAWAKGFFGTNSGVQAVPYGNVASVLEGYGFRKTYDGGSLGNFSTYAVPTGIRITSKFGTNHYWMQTEKDSNSSNVYVTRYINGAITNRYVASTLDSGIALYIQWYSSAGQWVVYIIAGSTYGNFPGVATNAYSISYLGMKDLSGLTIGNPVNYINNTEEAGNIWDAYADDEPVRLYPPTLPNSAQNTDQQNFYDYISQLQDWNMTANPSPNPNPDPDTDPGTDPDTDPDADPDKGLDLEPITEDWPSLTGVFPFSIPWDIAAVIGAFNATPEAPVFTFEFPANIFRGGGTVVWEMSEFETLAAIVRWVVFIMFLWGLLILTRKVTQW